MRVFEAKFGHHVYGFDWAVLAGVALAYTVLTWQFLRFAGTDAALLPLLVQWLTTVAAYPCRGGAVRTYSAALVGRRAVTLSTESAREQMFSRRAFVLGGTMAAVGVTLAARMTWLSVYQGEKYKLLSENNRVQLRLIPPRRGWIIDRTGKPLALNQPDYRLALIPEQVGDFEATLTAITKVLPLTEGRSGAHPQRCIARQPKYMAVEVSNGLDMARSSPNSMSGCPTLPGIHAGARLFADLPRRRAFRASARLYGHRHARAVSERPATRC